MNSVRLWLARLLLVGATLGVAASVQAAPIDYTITFVKTGGDGPLPTAGFFTYDADTPLFTNFHVVWNGTDYNMTGSANNPAYTGACGDLGGTPAAFGFAILTGATGCRSNQLWAGAAFADAVSLLNLFASVDAFNPNVGQMRTTAQIGLFETGPNDGAVRSVGGTFEIVPAITAVPEPASMTLLATGLAGVWLRRRRRG